MPYSSQGQHEDRLLRTSERHWTRPQCAERLPGQQRTVRLCGTPMLVHGLTNIVQHRQLKAYLLQLARYTLGHNGFKTLMQVQN